jgi:hypothetical protein
LNIIFKMEDKNLNQNAEETQIPLLDPQTAENAGNQEETIVAEESFSNSEDTEVPVPLVQETEKTDNIVDETDKVFTDEKSVPTETSEIETSEAETSEIEASETEVSKNETSEDTTSEVEATVNSKQKEELENLELEHQQVDKIAENLTSEHDDEHEELHEEKEEEDTTVYEELSLEQLVELMENLVKVENIATVKNKVLKTNIAYQAKYKEFKENHKKEFIEAGGVEVEYKYDDGGIGAKFGQSFHIYKQKRYEFNEAQELLKQDNLKRKEAILDELRSLIDSEESLKKIYDEFKNLQEKWRQIGMVPKNDTQNLWMNYNFLVDKFFEKVQIDRELRDIGFKKNLEAKIELAEKTEELLIEKSFTKSFKLLQEYHRQWKEIGPVPHDKSDEIWERFKSASEKVNLRRRDYYQTIAEDQNNNLVLKNDLIEKAELLSNVEYNTIKDWNFKTKEMDILRDEWKKIGPAPKPQNDEVWIKFMACFTSFYKQKKQYFSTLNDSQNENYQAKLDICKSAEALQTSTDWNNTTREIKKLQDEWKKIGPVPFKFADKIWKRFRLACDTFFNAKEEYFKHMKDHEKVNFDAKKALIETLKSKVFNENKETALAEIKELQKQWIEIGQVPFKDKDKINKDYRQAVDEKLSEIGISAIDVELSRIKERAGSGKEQERETRYMLQKEVSSIRMKIDKIKSEIGTWENNIGFFANSKNADVLKGEFQAKIDAGNKKIEALDARIRLLDKTIRSFGTE